MSFFTVKVALPRTVELTVCACNEHMARHGAEEFVATAFANALLFWDDNEPICDDEGRPLGEVQIEMSEEGMIELDPSAIKVTARRERGNEEANDPSRLEHPAIGLDNAASPAR